MLEHLEQLDLNADYDCNDFGVAADCYRKTPRSCAYRTAVNNRPNHRNPAVIAT